MIRIILLVLAFVMPAFADEFDYLVQCPSVTACQNDSTIGTYYGAGGVKRPDAAFLATNSSGLNGNGDGKTYVWIATVGQNLALHGHQWTLAEVDRDANIVVSTSVAPGQARRIMWVQPQPQGAPAGAPLGGMPEFMALGLPQVTAPAQGAVSVSPTSLTVTMGTYAGTPTYTQTDVEIWTGPSGSGTRAAAFTLIGTTTTSVVALTVSPTTYFLRARFEGTTVDGTVVGNWCIDTQFTTS